MMSKFNIRECLEILELSPAEAGQMLGVNQRTVKRWLSGETGITGPPEQALKAWVRLSDDGLPWRPDSVSLSEHDKDKIMTYKNHAIDLTKSRKRVDDRGGPSTCWEVDTVRKHATNGPLKVSYQKLPNGGFSPHIYTRKDMQPDANRDRHLLDDAYYCIAKKLKKNLDNQNTP